MQSVIVKIRVLCLVAVFLTLANGVLAPFSVQAQLKPSDPPTSLPKYSGVDQSIQDYLCAPKGLGTDLVDCVGRLYRFGITAGAISFIFFLVLAGYLYITSGEAGKGRAKDILLSAVTGMGILLGSFVLLNFINPSLTQIKTIQPPIFKAANLPSCEAIGFSTRCIISSGSSSGQVYQPPVTAQGCSNKESGGCTKANIMANCPKMAERMDDALRVCNHESGGGQVAIPSSTDLCLDDANRKVSFSHGLWQINITDSTGSTFPECENVLKRGEDLDGCAYPFRIGGSGECTVRLTRCIFPRGRDAYEKCRKALSDPVRNTRRACELFEKAGREAARGAWQPWPYTEKKVCKIPIWKF